MDRHSRGEAAGSEAIQSIDEKSLTRGGPGLLLASKAFERKDAVSCSKKGGHMKGIQTSRAMSIGTAAIAVVSIGAVAVGAVAIGAMTIGRLAIRRIAIEAAQIRSLEIEELNVRRLRAADVEVSGTLRMPASELSAGAASPTLGS